MFTVSKKVKLMLLGLALLVPTCNATLAVPAMADDGVFEQLNAQFQALFAPDSTVEVSRFFEDGSFVIIDQFGEEYRGCMISQPCYNEPPGLAEEMCGPLPCSATAEPTPTSMPTPLPPPPPPPCNQDSCLIPPVSVTPKLWLPQVEK